MCLAIPGKVHTIEDDMAVIDYNGLSKKASLRLYPDVHIGDFVLVHAGFVIQLLSEQEGVEMVKLAEEMDFEGNVADA